MKKRKILCIIAVCLTGCAACIIKGSICKKIAAYKRNLLKEATKQMIDSDYI